MTFIEPYVIIYGGVSPQQDFLDDIHLYDVRLQSWSGEIERKQCCNREEKVVETLGAISGLPLPGHDQVDELPIGFQGGVPSARAEHAVTCLGKYMYVFGGISEMGLLQDFYQFDPHVLKWNSITQLNQAWPTRRAGHSLDSSLGDASPKLYLFGGRASLSNGLTKSLNDVWVYDVVTKQWAESVARGGVAPVGRQHAASTVFDNELWIFGGLDSSSQVVFNDLWSFNLNVRSWTQRYVPAATSRGFIPPPLHHAHLLPSREAGVLVYGGVGSGASCGGATCGAASTVLGQLYRFDITSAQWAPSRLYPGAGDGSTDYVSGGDWKFARLSSDVSADTGGTGKYTKAGALEQIAVSRERNLLFEFGGVQFKPAVAAEQASRDRERIEERSGQGVRFHDTGSQLGFAPWDLYTAEQLRENVDIPFYKTSWYNSLPSAVTNVSQILFQNIFRQFSLVSNDVVLLSTVEISRSESDYIKPFFKYSDFIKNNTNL